MDWGVFVNQLKPVKSAAGWTMSDDFKNLRKFCKLKFFAKHRGKDHSKSPNFYIDLSELT